MAIIVAAGTACSSSKVLLGSREVVKGNGAASASLAQYNGLRPVENMQMAGLAGKKQNGFISTSGPKCRKIRAMASPTVSAPKREKEPKKHTVITGMGLVSVFGSEIDTFYNKLLDGESGITLIDRFDASKFFVRFGGQIRDFSSKGYIVGLEAIATIKAITTGWLPLLFCLLGATAVRDDLPIWSCDYLGGWNPLAAVVSACVSFFCFFLFLVYVEFFSDTMGMPIVCVFLFFCFLFVLNLLCFVLFSAISC